MSETKVKVELPPPFPDHTQLPDEDGSFVKNFQEHPQSILLTDSIGLILQQRHPDGNYAIGQDCGIYWRETEPPEKGAEPPDWFYVPINTVSQPLATGMDVAQVAQILNFSVEEVRQISNS